MRLEIETAAMPKARPRAGQGRVYMPKPYMDWKQSVAEEALFRGAVLLDEPIAAIMEFGREKIVLEYEPLGYATSSRAGLLTGDVDNYIGGVMDALEGVCWTNDRLIWNATGVLV